MHTVPIEPTRPQQRARGGRRLEPASRPKVIDLFAGVGGLSLGAARAGFDVAAVVENDPLALETHARNFPESEHLEAEIGEGYSGVDLLRAAGLERGELSGLIGGPPCQGFSPRGKREQGDERNELFVHFFRLVAETLPDFYLAENVAGIMDRRYEAVRKKALAQLPPDYVVLEPFKANARDFGAPTSRVRAFFIGYRKDAISGLTVEDFEPPAGVEHVTVRIALQGLPDEIDPGWQSEADGWRPVKRNYKVPSSYAERCKGHIPPRVGDPLAVSRLEKEKIVSGCLGTRHREDVVKRFHKLKPGEKEPISQAARLDPDGFCPTIRAGTNSDRGSHQALRPIHPTRPRVITPREAARLQGFPDWFVFHPTKWHSFRQIGNSVSPILAEHLLRVISCKVEAKR